MGRTYTVPRSVKGESRILYIFTVKSLITSILFAAVGVIPYFLLSSIGLKIAGIVFIVIFAAIGYGMSTLIIPDTPILGKLRKAGGELLGDVIWRTITFSKRKKIYLYREGGKKQWDKI
ncbi:MAG: hypothetical protein PHH93_10945 [Prolixibacteraceae bacterium]|nr:hypothetical protein [Prolixibacteraceae bacterium]